MADKIQHNTVEKLGDDYSKNYGMFSIASWHSYDHIYSKNFVLPKEKKHYEKGKCNELVL